MSKNLADFGGQVCQMTLLVKDHKGWQFDSESPPPSRPVVAGNSGLNCHLSELLSKIVEPIAFEETGNEVDSTSDMLARIANINEKLSSKKPIIDNIEIPPKINVSQAMMNVSEEKVDISPAMMNVSQEMRKIVEKPNFKQNSSSDKKCIRRGILGLLCRSRTS